MPKHFRRWSRKAGFSSSAAETFARCSDCACCESELLCSTTKRLERTQRFTTVPLMLDPSHQQRAFEFSRTGRKIIYVAEQVALHVRHIEWCHPPIETA